MLATRILQVRALILTTQARLLPLWQLQVVVVLTQVVSIIPGQTHKITFPSMVVVLLRLTTTITYLSLMTTHSAHQQVMHVCQVTRQVVPLPAEAQAIPVALAHHLLLATNSQTWEKLIRLKGVIGLKRDKVSGNLMTHLSLTFPRTVE